MRDTKRGFAAAPILSGVNAHSHCHINAYTLEHRHDLTCALFLTLSSCRLPRNEMRCSASVRLWKRQKKLSNCSSWKTKLPPPRINENHYFCLLILIDDHHSSNQTCLNILNCDVPACDAGKKQVKRRENGCEIEIARVADGAHIPKIIWHT